MVPEFLRRIDANSSAACVCVRMFVRVKEHRVACSKLSLVSRVTEIHVRSYIQVVTSRGMVQLPRSQLPKRACGQRHSPDLFPLDLITAAEFVDDQRAQRAEDQPVLHRITAATITSCKTTTGRTLAKKNSPLLQARLGRDDAQLR